MGRKGFFWMAEEDAPLGFWSLNWTRYETIWTSLESSGAESPKPVYICMARVTRRVHERMAQNVAQPIFTVEKKQPKKIRATLVNFVKLPKVNTDPIGRKFAQSGHPTYGQRCCLTYIDMAIRRVACTYVHKWTQWQTEWQKTGSNVHMCACLYVCICQVQ
jgi:hypothetical protein